MVDKSYLDADGGVARDSSTKFEDGASVMGASRDLMQLSIFMQPYG